VSDLRDRLNVLAERGTKRGADAVLEAARRKVAIGVIDGEHEFEATDPIPFVDTEPIETRRPRRKFGSLITAAGVSMMLLVGMLAMSALVGSGGAGSPEAAVRQLANAVSHEDPLAAADVLAPNELRTLHATVDKAQRKAAEKDLVESAGAPLAGIDFSVDDVELTTTELADGFAKVTVTGGRFRASTTKADFSPLMQKALRDSEDESGEIDLANTDGELFGGMPSFVVTVREGDNWYVSAAYTALEYIREYNELPAADFGSGVRAVSTLGADSPDAAVQDAVRALQQSDWAKLLTLTPPSEIPAYDFRDALVAWAEREDVATEFTLNALSTTSEMHGDTALVTLHAAGTTDSGPWSIDGGCYAAPYELEPSGPDNEPVPFRYCVPRAPAELFDGVWSAALPPDDGPSQITTVRHEGRWFVSPTGTVLDVLEQWVDNIGDPELYGMLDLPEPVAPKGEIRMGETITVPGAERGVHVYTFEGRRGQRLLGLVEGRHENSAAWARLAGPSGEYLEEDAFYGSPAELPEDGSYRVYVFNRSDADARVTIWNEQDAPEKARDPYGQGVPPLSGADCETVVTPGSSPNESGVTTFCESGGELK
jgi:hypothetical protein